MSKKSQSAIEFIILIGAMFFFFILLMQAFQKNTADKTIAQRNLIANDITLTVQNEINLAHSSRDGYERTFSLPDKIQNINYTINLTEGFIYLQTTDGNIALAHPVKNITGNVQKGDNVIKKVDREVFINRP
ncbi:MAG: hypothetical protein ABIG28_02480 [archaeon]